MVDSLPSHLLSTIASIALISVISYPLLVHFFVIWKQKSDDIILSMNSESARLYFLTFRKTDIELDAAAAKFRALYVNLYGRRFLVVPILILSVIALISTVLIGESGEYYLRIHASLSSNDHFLSLPEIAVAAVTGAYAFVCWDIVSRVAQRSLTPADILGTAIRLGLAIPIGYAFSAVVKADIGGLIAFAIGAFPLETVKTLLQRLANRKLGLEMGPDSEIDQVTKLSGVDQNVADRIGEADITTIAQMAYCDPVQVTMRSRYTFAFISDVTAQALAWIYLEDKLNSLRPLGLRGAAEFSNLRDALKSSDQLEKAEAAGVAMRAALRVNMTVEEFRNVLEEIAEDPFTQFLVETW